MWGLSSNSPMSAPIYITSKPAPLTTGGLGSRGDLPTSPRPIFELDKRFVRAPLGPAWRNPGLCQFGNFSPLPRGMDLAHHGACSPTLCWWRTQTMKTRKPLNYLRSYRLRWGLSQGELAHLLGWKGAEVISRIEKKQRPPTLQFVMACFILFGTSAAELFPDVAAGIEAGVMARVWEMYERIQGEPSKKTKTKIELFESAIDRAEQRKHAPRL